MIKKKKGKGIYDRKPVLQKTLEGILRTRGKEETKHYKINKMAAISRSILKISLSVNDLNCPVKRYRLGGWIIKQGFPICCLQETHLTTKDRHRLGVKVLKVFKANGPRKQTGVNVPVPDKTDFLPTAVKSN